METFKSPLGEASPFLRLPIELRRAIYSYLLPYTCTSYTGSSAAKEKVEYNLTLVRQPQEVWKMQKISPRTDRETGHAVVWQRGHTSILATNHQLHDECVDMIYGQNTFVIDITFDKIMFRQCWRTITGLMPSRSYPFLEHFSQRNLMRIKHYVIIVEHVDDYTGMIKYNHGGRGLTAGIRARVQELVELLNFVPYLVDVHVHLIDGAINRIRFYGGRVHRVQDEANYAQPQSALDPLYQLCGVRKARVTGVSSSYATRVEKRMMSPKGRVELELTV